MDFFISMIQFLSIQKAIFWVTLFLIVFFSFFIIHLLACARKHPIKIAATISVIILCMIVGIGFKCYSNYGVVKDKQLLFNLSKIVDEKVMNILSIKMDNQ
jgi:uncharacterized membrane protein